MLRTANYLSQLFEKYDRDQDQALSPQEVVNYFSTCPRMPWGPEVYYQVQGCPPQEVVNYFSTCPRMPWGPEVYYQVPHYRYVIIDFFVVQIPNTSLYIKSRTGNLFIRRLNHKNLKQE